MFPKLFSPIKIRGLELRNRVVMAGMGTHMVEDGYFVADNLIPYHAVRAKGGVGLNVVEVCSIDQGSAQAGMLSLGEDRFIPKHKLLTDAIHSNGGKASIQLWQGGMAVMSDPKARAYVPSDIPLSPEYTLPGMSAEDINHIVDAYGQAARRAVEAGYDTVEFHAAHNYLPHMFLSGGMNFRTDEYGGSLENRARFPLECIRSIRKMIPEDMPLFMRVDAFDDGLPNGLTLEEVAAFCKMAKEAGVDVVNVSRGNFSVPAALIYEVPPCDLPNGYNIDPTAYIRKESGLLALPTGRINTPELAEKVLEADKADLVVMARAQLADPEFCNKAKAGKLSRIKYCVGCDQGCYDYFVNPEKAHISCLRNPAVGKESEIDFTPVATPKKVLIAGGGIGGIESADFLHKRGHQPILCEAGAHLGGQFLLAGMAPRKDDFKRAVEMAVQNVQELGIDIRLNTPVTPERIAEEKPDAVIIAIGSNPIVPKIPGADGKNVLESHQVLAGAEVPSGPCVIVGGGLVGMEVAEYLHEQGRDVTVVEMKDTILQEMGEIRRTATELTLKDKQINILLNTTCREIRGNQVLVEQGGQEITLTASAIVMAIGSKPRPSDDLKAACDAAGIPYYVIGDALAAPRLGLNAIHEAFEAAFRI